MTVVADPCAWLGELIEWDSHSLGVAIDSIQSARDHLERGGGTTDEAPPVIKAIGITAHIVCARRIWLSRMGVGEAPDEVFPAPWPMDRLRSEAGEVGGLWRGFMRPLTPADLERVVSYRSTDGRAWATRTDDIIFHTLTHSHYHRGQVARLVAEAGGQPAATDYIFAVRRPAEAGSAG